MSTSPFGYATICFFGETHHQKNTNPGCANPGFVGWKEREREREKERKRERVR